MQTSRNTNTIDVSPHATRRLMVLLIFLVIAAMPLLWLTLDQRAGDKLLYLTQVASR